MDTASNTNNLKSAAKRLGFSLVGICPAAPPAGWSRLRDWLELGYDGAMTYLRDRLDAYQDPAHVMSGVRSILMLAMPYRTCDPISPNVGEGRVSRYAWGPIDYHDLIHERLR